MIQAGNESNMAMPGSIRPTDREQARLLVPSRAVPLGTGGVHSHSGMPPGS